MEALNGDPHLYLAYLKEQEAKLAPVPAVAEFESPTCAPGWSKYAGARLSDLTIDDLRDLHRMARAPSMRQAVEFEMRRRARRHAERHPRRPRVFA